MGQVADDPIQAYHDLLDEPLAAATQGRLDELQRRQGLYFGDRPLCTVLRPRLLKPQQYHFLRRRVDTLLSAACRLHARALADTEFRKFFRLTDDEETLFAAEPGYSSPSPSMRLDAFYCDDEHLSFTEFNAETPAAPGYCDALADVFLSLPATRRFQRDWQLRPVPTRYGVEQALLDAYEEWSGGAREAPRIAIVDFKDVPTYSEFVLFQEFFLSRGFECKIAAPQELEFRGGKLWADGMHVTVVYKRVLVSELLAAGGMKQPLVEAALAGAVCVVNGFRGKLLYKKAALAALSDDRFADMFPAAEQEAVRLSIPWTRLMEDRPTAGPDGAAVDLPTYVAREQEQLVLKPNDDYGGHGVVLGWTATASEWDGAIQKALAGDYVVQRRVPVPSEIFPSYADGQLHFAARQLDTNPYAVGARHMEGMLTRISTAALINVTAGGGSTVPTFLVEAR